jgi:hypothetical protein
LLDRNDKDKCEPNQLPEGQERDVRKSDYNGESLTRSFAGSNLPHRGHWGVFIFVCASFKGIQSILTENLSNSKFVLTSGNEVNENATRKRDEYVATRNTSPYH